MGCVMSMFAWRSELEEPLLPFSAPPIPFRIPAGYSLLSPCTSKDYAAMNDHAASNLVK